MQFKNLKKKPVRSTDFDTKRIADNYLEDTDFMIVENPFSFFLFPLLANLNFNTVLSTIVTMLHIRSLQLLRPYSLQLKVCTLSLISPSLKFFKP